MLQESLTDSVRTHTGWRTGSREVEVRSQGKSLCLAQPQPEQTRKLSAAASAAAPLWRSRSSRLSLAEVRRYLKDADGSGRTRLPDLRHTCKTASS